MTKISYDEKKVLMICVAILTILFIVALTTTNFQEQYWNKQLQKIQRHYQQWTAQKISKYQISIYWKGVPVNCMQELIIENNRIEKVVQNNCKSSDGTVENLFSIVRRPVEIKQCGVNGCTCDGPFIMDVIYDEKYGFPKTAKSAYHPEERWRFQSENWDWQKNGLFGHKLCTLAGNFITAWEIDAFLPLE